MSVKSPHRRAASDEELENDLARVSWDHPRRALALRELLGDAVCRQLGIVPIPDDFKLSVVIPVFNERQWIHEVVHRVEQAPLPKEIILIDDCSTER